MAYSVYLDKILFPVTPSKIQMKIRNQNKTINLINEDEVNLLKGAGLTDISISFLLPQTKYPFAVYMNGFKPADYYLTHIKKLKTDKQPFQFIVSRVSQGGMLLFDTNMTVSIEDYDISEDAKNGFDITVSVKLKQYRAYGTKTVSIETGQNNNQILVAGEERPAQSAQNVKTYTVVSGDSLWNIAKKLLGNGSRYTEIAELNKDKVVNPNLIYPGQVLKIP